MSKLHELANYGQSIWLDYIRRDILENGELQSMIDDGVRGMTSNPTIFEKAIAGGDLYDEDVEALAAEGKSALEIYDALSLKDIHKACELLSSVFKETEGADGYVSVEVSPELAHDTEKTIAEARRLREATPHDNLMIKVPATNEGIPAVKTLIAEGVNVNVTLIFSVEYYRRVAEAYIAGLEERAANGEDVSKVASVASFFVSRVDTQVDAALEAKGEKDLQGTIAVANSKIAYAEFQNIFSGDRWEALAAKGAKPQRPLWASTGTKNPAYSDVKYVDELIAPQTVNTVPPDTLDAFLERGTVSETATKDVDAERERLAKLGELGVDLEKITDDLLDDGVKKFADSFRSLLESVEGKRSALKKKSSDAYKEQLGDFREQAERTFERLLEENVIERIGKKDHTVWSEDPREISNRLGWLDCVETAAKSLPEIDEFVEEVRAAGFRQALLMGMGGSSLAPEVFAKIFGDVEGGLPLTVIDTTAPETVLHRAESIDPKETLHIVSTKSGGTVETLSLAKYFYNRAKDALGDDAGATFVAVTDPGSGLEALAKKLSFRKIFLNDPNIGGRFSALSLFGLVPAALTGVDIRRLLDRAESEATLAKHADERNVAARLGATMAAMAKAGKDKLTLFASKEIEPFGAWVEQLVAESLGKSGFGVLPIVGDVLEEPGFYSRDRFFVFAEIEGAAAFDEKANRLEAAGAPLARIALRDEYDLGAEFFRWEFATAIAGWAANVHPFDQPNVEATKRLAKATIEEFKKTGAFRPEEPTTTIDGLAIYGEAKDGDLASVLHEFFFRLQPGDENHAGRSYAAIQAFVPPTRDFEKLASVFRETIERKFQIATTFGFGPRFLHSTGQAHKGDAGAGLFLQFTYKPNADAPIPDEPGAPTSSVDFGTLIRAQALGDREALKESGRVALRVDLGDDPLEGLRKIVDTMK